MLTQFVAKNLNKAESASVQDYVNKKLPHLEILLKEFDDDTVHCKVTAEKFERKKACKVTVELALPKQTLYCYEDDHTFPEAIDIAMDTLMRITKKYKDRLHGETKKKEWRPLQEAFEEAEPMLREKAGMDQEAFFKSVVPLMTGLRAFISREVEQYQLSREIDPEDLRASEVIDETVLHIFDNFSDKPMGLTLEQWFYQKGLEILKNKVEKVSEVRDTEEYIETRVPLEDVPLIPEHLSEDQLDFYQRDEKLALSDVIPDPRFPTPAEVAEVHEQKEFILKTLGTLPAIQREAFALNILEGFSESEIADLQHRKIETVRKDIRDTQKILKAQAEHHFGIVE